MNWIDPELWDGVTETDGVLYGDIGEHWMTTEELIRWFEPDPEYLRLRQEAWGRAWENVFRLATESTGVPVVKWGEPCMPDQEQREFLERWFAE